jgi:hypothetical protein
MHRKKKTKTSLISEKIDDNQSKKLKFSSDNSNPNFSGNKENKSKGEKDYKILSDNDKQISNNTNQLSDTNTSSDINKNDIKNKKSWKLFFNSQSKVLPDFNRAIKNNPDNEFFEFYDVNLSFI